MKTRLIMFIALLLTLTSSLTFGGFPASDLYLASVARASGSGGSSWYTTVWIHNPNASTVQVSVSLLRRGMSNLSPQQQFVNVGPGETMLFRDALLEVFGESDVAGAMRFECPSQIVVSSRIYNDTGAGLSESQGQFFAGTPVGFSIGQGEFTDIPGITQPADASFRCNFGMVETDGGNVQVTATLHNSAGGTEAVKTYSLGPYQPMQVSLSDLGDVNVDGGRLHLEVTSGSGRVLAFASMVGNGAVSQDPSTLEMEYEFPEGTITGVTAGNGLTGGGTQDDVTLNVGQGAGISVSSDAISIVDGGVTKTKLSASGGSSGQVLGTDGSNLVWQPPSTGGVTDHGHLSGLGDNDHPQYLLTSGGNVNGDLTVSGYATIDGGLSFPYSNLYFGEVNQDGAGNSSISLGARTFCALKTVIGGGTCAISVPGNGIWSIQASAAADQFVLCQAVCF